MPKAETGEPVKGVTGQGYHDGSCWSRGQALGIYGFALMYGYTKYVDDSDEKEKYKDIAKKMLSNLTEHCGALDMADQQPILLHGCIGQAYKDGSENVLVNTYTDTPTVYGDYFYTETLIKITHDDFKVLYTGNYKLLYGRNQK